METPPKQWMRCLPQEEPHARRYLNDGKRRDNTAKRQQTTMTSYRYSIQLCACASKQRTNTAKVPLVDASAPSLSLFHNGTNLCS